MRDFHLSWDVVVGLIGCACGALWCLLCQLPTASLAFRFLGLIVVCWSASEQPTAFSHRSGHGCTVGIDRDPPV